jgi:hypothetical protein
MDPQSFRRIALGLNDASEGAHMGHPDFRVNGRIFATLHQDGVRGMVQLTPEVQQELIDLHPEVFERASGAWGRGGSTMVRLGAIDEATLGEAMTLAWHHAHRLRPATPGSRKRAPEKPRAGAASGRPKPPSRSRR